MAETVKSMQQASPSGSGEVALYTCPALTRYVASSIYACNQNSAPVTIRIRVAIGDAPAADGQYLLYDLPFGANTSMVMTCGVTFEAGDVIYVDASSSGVSFQMSGVEIT